MEPENLVVRLVGTVEGKPRHYRFQMLDGSVKEMRQEDAVWVPPRKVRQPVTPPAATPAKPE